MLKSSQTFRVLLCILSFGCCGMLTQWISGNREAPLGTRTRAQPFTSSNVRSSKRLAVNLPQTSLQRVSSDFRVSRYLANSLECTEQLKNVELVAAQLSEVLEAGEWNIEIYSGDLFLKNVGIDQLLRAIVMACHGPVPPGLLLDVSASRWISSLHACDHHGMVENDQNISNFRPAFKAGFKYHFDGEWCVGGWRGYLSTILGKDPEIWDALSYNTQGRISYENARSRFRMALNQTLWCAMHLEFPLTPLPARRVSSSFSRKKIGKMILLALTLNSSGTVTRAEQAEMGGKLARTAVIQGWDTYFAVGKFTGLVGKYQRALEALNILQLDHDDIVVFVDSSDVLVQQSPQQVRNIIENGSLNGDFVFSGEGNCFPMGGWPYNLGLDFGRYICTSLFPKVRGRNNITGVGNAWVNTGGWIATARSAELVLEELRILTELHRDNMCYIAGSDQLLGNALYLRHNARQKHSSLKAGQEGDISVDIDVDSTIFVSAPWQASLSLTEASGQTRETPTAAFCHGNAPRVCPAFLHFNGGGKERILERFESELQQAWDSSCHKGSLSLIDVDDDVIVQDIQIESTNQLPACN